MKNTEWPKSEIQRLAKSSGKPLEVSCAEGFLGAGWKARLGSHFADGALDTIRELDVLAEKEEVLAASLPVRVRALVSCRGFPPERSPLAYSVSQSSVPSFAPRVLSGHRTQDQPWPGLGPAYGPLDDLEGRAATRLLQASELSASRSLVAFDMLERNEVVPKRKKNMNTDEATATYSRCRDGDRQLFGAVDSSVKAAFFWVKEDYQRQQPFATLNVPVCILSLPFWDTCIDGGNVAEPDVKHRGYQSNAYPGSPVSKEVMTLVWDVAELPDLIAALDNLFLWFRDEIRIRSGLTTG
jgi:hypothetical protein